MNIAYTVDPSGALAMFDRVVKFTEEDAIRIAADVVKLNIETETARGIDQDGNPFEPYADSTAKTRARKGLQTDFVDLTFAGLMMDGIQFADNYLYVGGEHGYIADFHMLGGDHLPSRQFFKAGETVGPLIERAIAGAIVRL